MILNVTDLTIARGGMPVLAGVSFELAAGQALILRGPNGVGKTTLLRTIAGLQPALSGEVTGAEDQIAYAAHSDGLKAMLSVRENLTFWAEVFGQSDIEPALEAFDLNDLAERLAGTLSAGQKRRLGLARLLVTARPIWILDEPTVSLDTASVDMFGRAVWTHLQNGGMALIATHIDLGLTDAKVLDATPFIARADVSMGSSDEAFL
jgi:heme exporter protein A|tara:strand:- start:2999 stop:3619 length:621 start_codon:yes stop_codon:yes gene_type:complete